MGLQIFGWIAGEFGNYICGRNGKLFAHIDKKVSNIKPLLKEI